MTRLDHPHDDECPNCGNVAWDNQDDPQQCGACGTRVCPDCGADFGEDYDPDTGERLTDNLGDHIALWHPEMQV